nr:MAG TPA: hypothetical protein [Crassvirales sp.]
MPKGIKLDKSCVSLHTLDTYTYHLFLYFLLNVSTACSLLGKVVITNLPSFSSIIDHSKACFPTRITLRPSGSVAIARTVESQFDL